MGNLAVGDGCAVLVLAVPAARKEKISHQSKIVTKRTHIKFHIISSSLVSDVASPASRLCLMMDMYVSAIFFCA